MTQVNDRCSRSRRGISIRKGLKILVTVLLIYSLGSMLLSAVMFRVLFPRRDGVSDIRYTYADVDSAAYPRTAFSFDSCGHAISACRYEARRAKGEIAVINGIGAGMDSHLAEIMYFVDHGWTVVTWDATGLGGSGGRGIMGLQQIRLDLLAYLDYRERTGETLPLVLYGHSAGAYAAATVLDGDYGVRAAVCLCAFDSPAAVMLYHARQRVGVLADAQYPFLLLESYFLFGADADVSAVDAVSRSRVPVLAVESSSDDLVPHELGLAGRGAYQNPNVTVMTVDTAWRNEHNTPWLSPAAAEYVGGLKEGQRVDKARANQLDQPFMEQILTFFNDAVDGA